MQFGGFGGIEVVLFLLSKGSELQMIEKIPSTALSKALQCPNGKAGHYIVNGLLSKPKKFTRSLFTTQSEHWLQWETTGVFENQKDYCSAVQLF